MITKDIAYLGSSIEEVKESLEKLPAYGDKIRKSYRLINLFLESNHFLEKVKKLKLKEDAFLRDRTEEVEACKLHYLSVFDKLDELTKKESLKNFVVEFVYNNASIEGNMISLNEARNLLNEGITPKDKTLREIYDLQNSEKVFFELFGNLQELKLDHELIISVHDKLLENIDARKGYRTQDIRVVKSNFEASPGKYVKTDMGLLLKWYLENTGKLHPLVLALVFQHKLERIHPFMDGNGRTGRMLMNFILLKHNLPPMIIHKKTRKEYLDVLREADEGELWKVDKHYFELVNYGASEFIEGYWGVFL